MIVIWKAIMWEAGPKRDIPTLDNVIKTELNHLFFIIDIHENLFSEILIDDLVSFNTNNCWG